MATSGKKSAKQTRLVGREMSSIWYGAHGIKFTEEFRDVVYKINPLYLSCMYKTMFESNATNNLRKQDDEVGNSSPDPFEKKSSSDFNDNKTNSSLTNRASRSMSGIESACSEHSIVTRSHSQPCSNDYIQRRTHEFGGWNVCPRSHSAHNYSFQRRPSTESNKDPYRSRSRSASVNLAFRREKTKLNKGSARCPPMEYAVIHRDEDKNGDVHAFSSSSSVSGSSHSTPGYNCAPKPIHYKFKHFDYSSNYMEQYRNEVTYKRITQSTKSTASECRCETRSQVLPGKQAVFRWIDNDPIHNQEERKHQPPTSPTVNNMNNYTLQSSQIFFQPGDRSRQSPHYLLAHNGVLKMEFYNNPLAVDNTKTAKDKQKPTGVCRNRPSIPSTVRGNIYPKSTSTPPIKRNAINTKKSNK